MRRTFLPPLICLMGPTASGKTKLAIQLASHLPVRIISVDSAMVYRGLDIGTAKPSLEIRQRIPHSLIDVVDPEEVYSVGRFREDVLVAIKQAQQAKQLPILVGGTMLYFRCLQQGLAPLPPAHPIIRAQIEQEAQEVGWAAMHHQLAAIDPPAALRIHPSDTQRIQRALEVYRCSGKPMTILQNEGTQALRQYQIFNYVLMPQPRSDLHTRIISRLDQMIESGFIEEVQRLFQRQNMHCNLPSLRSVGYKELWQYHAGQLTLAMARERTIIATRQLAKRQITWLRRWPNSQCFNHEHEAFSSILKEITALSSHLSWIQ